MSREFEKLAHEVESNADANKALHSAGDCTWIWDVLDAAVTIDSGMLSHSSDGNAGAGPSSNAAMRCIRSVLLRSVSKSGSWRLYEAILAWLAAAKPGTTPRAGTAGSHDDDDNDEDNDASDEDDQVNDAVGSEEVAKSIQSVCMSAMRLLEEYMKVLSGESARAVELLVLAVDSAMAGAAGRSRGGAGGAGGLELGSGTGTGTGDLWGTQEGEGEERASAWVVLDNARHCIAAAYPIGMALLGGESPSPSSSSSSSSS